MFWAGVVRFGKVCVSRVASPCVWLCVFCLQVFFAGMWVPTDVCHSLVCLEVMQHIGCMCVLRSLCVLCVDMCQAVGVRHMGTETNIKPIPLMRSWLTGSDEMG